MRIVVPAAGHTFQASYFTELLRQTLQRTEAVDGPFVIEQHPLRVSLARSLEMLKGGQVHVIWTVTDAVRERELLPVRVSLLRELNNYRVFLIREAEQPRFDQVRTLEDLRRFKAGAGTHWADTAVLRNNGLAVETSVRYDALFGMLAAGRFDFFPRGLYEAWPEAQAHQQSGLRLENTLMLYYESPFYFFVSKDNPALARRIERGLQLAMADGSFDRLLYSYPAFQRGWRELAHSRRTVFRLQPVMPAQ